jgi:CBS domain-containing protein
MRTSIPGRRGGATKGYRTRRTVTTSPDVGGRPASPVGEQASHDVSGRDAGDAGRQYGFVGGRRISRMTVETIARTEVVTVDLEATLAEIAGVMRDERVGSVVVVDGKGTVAGILTDRDLVVAGLAEGRAPDTCIANDILSTNVFAVDPDTDVASVARRMREESVRRVLVMRGHDLVGIVTLDDLLVHLGEEFDCLTSVVRSAFPD